MLAQVQMSHTRRTSGALFTGGNLSEQNENCWMHTKFHSWYHFHSFCHILNVERDRPQIIEERIENDILCHFSETIKEALKYYSYHNSVECFNNNFTHEIQRLSAELYAENFQMAQIFSLLLPISRTNCRKNEHFECFRPHVNCRFSPSKGPILSCKLSNVCSAVDFIFKRDLSMTLIERNDGRQIFAILHY